MNFEDYLDYLDEAILIVDPSYDVVSFNGAFAKLFPSVRKSAYALPCLADCPALQELVLQEEPAQECEISLRESRYSVSVADIHPAGSAGECAGVGAGERAGVGALLRVDRCDGLRDPDGCC